jgi:hypothetical protein
MKQAEALYDSHQESEYNRFVLDAKLRGVDVEKEIKKAEKKKTFTFQDPKEYEKMPIEKRRELTDQMLGEHKGQFKKEI